MTQQAINYPAQTIRDGRLKATIWLNESEKGKFYSVELSRTYTDQRGRPKDTASFTPSDLMRLVWLIHRAYTVIHDLKTLHKIEAEEEAPEAVTAA